MIKYWRNNLFI